MAAEATPTSATHETSAATIATRPRRRFRGCVDTSFLTADYLPTHGWPPSSGRWRGNQSAGGTLSPDPVRVLLLTRIYGVAVRFRTRVALRFRTRPASPGSTLAEVPMYIRAVDAVRATGLVKRFGTTTA